jgi:Sigma-70, region 4
MVSDRNRQIIERRRSGESFSAIGSALGISRERVRQIVEREERSDQRARELEEAARLPQQPNPLQLAPRLRNMLRSCSEHPTLRPTTSSLLNIRLRSPILERA